MARAIWWTFLLLVGGVFVGGGLVELAQEGAGDVGAWASVFIGLPPFYWAALEPCASSGKRPQSRGRTGY
jgi:hypothetical protein